MQNYYRLYITIISLNIFAFSIDIYIFIHYNNKCKEQKQFKPVGQRGWLLC